MIATKKKKGEPKRNYIKNAIIIFFISWVYISY